MPYFAETRLVGVREASHRVGLSPSTLKKYRRENRLIEGIHYFRIGKRKILYNLDLLLDMAVSCHTPEIHLKNCEAFLKKVSK